MKNKEPLKVGDTIRFVGPVSGEIETRHFFTSSTEGTVLEHNGHPSAIRVRFAWKATGQIQEGSIHRRQVTHVLVPRPRKERKERATAFGVRRPPDLEWYQLFYFEKAARESVAERGGEVIPLSQLFPGETIVSREDLAKAWNKLAQRNVMGVRLWQLEDLCKALGLPSESGG